MLTRNLLLHHFRKQMFHGGIDTLISYVLLVGVTTVHMADLY